MSPTLNYGPLITDFIEDVIGMSIQKPNTVMLQVAMDISGAAQDRYAAYGVVVGLAREWKLFHEEWGRFLEKHQLDHIRMAHAMSFNGAFKPKFAEWGERREEVRHQVLSEAAHIIAATLKVHAASRDLQAGNYPSEKEGRRRYIKATMFGYVIQKLLAQESEEYALALMCDEEQDVAKQFLYYLDRFKHQHHSVAHRIAALCFCNDTRVPQLQAADIVAYVSREKKAGKENPIYSILFNQPTHSEDQVTILW